METEAETLRYVQSQRGILIPEILYDWIDKRLSRSFLILKLVDGETL